MATKRSHPRQTLLKMATLLVAGFGWHCASEPKTVYKGPRAVSEDLSGRTLECSTSVSFALAGPGYDVEIKPLIDGKCVNCHPGVAAPALNTYTLVKDNLVAVLDEVNGNRMPPNNPLSADEKALLQAWADGGAPQVAPPDPTPTPAPSAAPDDGDPDTEPATDDPSPGSGEAGESDSADAVTSGYEGSACSSSNVETAVCQAEGGLPIENLCFRDVFECDHETVLAAFADHGIDINPRLPANYEIDGCAYMRYADGSLSGRIPVVAIRFVNSNGETVRRVLTID